MFFREVNMDNSIHYKRNNISNVILQIEFLKNETLSFIDNSKIYAMILENFPTQNIDTIDEVEVRVNNPQEVPGVDKHQYIRKSFSKDYSCKLSVLKKMISLESNNYIDFNSFYGNIQGILKTIFEEFPNEQTIRIGLRFINMFPYDKNLKSYFNEHIKNYISFYLNEKSAENKLSRTMNRAEFLNQGKRIVLQYGFFNPSYPAILTKEDFVLDIDSINTSVFGSYEDINAAILQAHFSICELFENCISDRLRGKLNE